MEGPWCLPGNATTFFFQHLQRVYTRSLQAQHVAWNIWIILGSVVLFLASVRWKSQDVPRRALYIFYTKNWEFTIYMMAYLVSRGPSRDFCRPYLCRNQVNLWLCSVLSTPRPYSSSNKSLLDDQWPVSSDSCRQISPPPQLLVSANLGHLAI